MNLKKLIATNLSFMIIASGGNKLSCAWAPDDYDNPKCINLNKLNKKRVFYHEGKICKCKTCSVDAVAYNELENYINKLNKRLTTNNRVITSDKKINYCWNLQIRSDKFSFIN